MMVTATQKKVFPKGNVLKLTAVRLSYPKFWEPTAFEEGQVAKYGCTYLLDPKKPHHKTALKALNDEIDRLLKTQWGLSRAKLTELRTTAAKKGKQVPAHQDIVIEFTGDGDDYTDQAGAIRAGYAVMVYIKAKSEKQPLVVEKDSGEEARKNHPDAVGGKYVNATINLYIQDDKNGKAIRCSLRGVQLLGYGKPFGSVVDKKELEDFEDFDADDEDDDDLAL